MERAAFLVGGTRSLIIVDEALANAVDHNQATSNDLDVVLRAVPHALREPHSSAIRTLETLKVFLDGKEKPQAPGSESVEMLWGAGSSKCSDPIRQLRDALCAVQFDPALYNEDALGTVADILEDVEMMLDRYAYYYRSGAQHSLNSSRYLLPQGCRGS